jgi:hypothetical protein
MLYRKIRVSQLDDTKKLYRVMFVPEEISLYHLASVLIRAFRGDEDDMYRFVSSRGNYVLSCDMEYPDDRLMSDCILEDPGTAYKFIYDYVDSWEFEVRLLDETKELDSSLMGIVIEGAGAGVWQDDRSGYTRLLSECAEGNPVISAHYDPPYNLDLIKVTDTFAQINPVLETSRLAEEPYPDEDEYDGDSGVWTKFNELYDSAYGAFPDKSNDGKIWLETWAEFSNVCAQLKENGELPETFIELVRNHNDFMGWDLPGSLADHLPDYELYEELWQIMNELDSMFRMEGDYIFEVFRGKWEALCGLGRNEELLLLSRDMYRKYPGNMTVRIYLLKAYDIHKMYKEGLEMIRSVLDKEGDECNENNVGFFHEAAGFADSAGEKKLAGKLAEAAREEFLRLQETGEDDFLEDDDYHDVLEDFRSEMLAHLGEAVRKVCASGDPEDMFNLISGLALMAKYGCEVYVPYQDGRDGGISMATMDDDRSYLIVYSDENVQLPAGQEMISVPLDELIDEIMDETADGLIIDPQQSNPYFAVVDSKMLDVIRTVAFHPQDDDEYEDEED